MKNLSELVASFLEAESKSLQKTIPVIVQSTKKTPVDVMSYYCHSNDLGLITLDATTIQEFFSVDVAGNLNTGNFTSKVYLSDTIPCVLLVDHFQLVNNASAAIVRAIANYAITGTPIPWLAPGSSIVFMDYVSDKPRPFFLSEYKLQVLTV